MGKQWAEIRRDWPGVDDLAYESGTIVDAFNRRSDRLGSQLPRDLGPAAGTMVPLSIVCDGRRLSALDGIADVDRFVRRLRRDELAAWAELEALYILRSGATRTEAETEPSIAVGQRLTAPDWRIRQAGTDPWTYVEVARPRESSAKARVSEYLRPFATDLAPGDSRAVSLILRRRPTAHELDHVREVIAEAHANPPTTSIELAEDLGVLLVQVERTASDQGGAMVKWVVPDDRGIRHLVREAKQLPEGSSTIVMLDVSSTLVDWSSSLTAHLAKGEHPWISAVCLFTSDFAASPRGESWTISVRLVENPMAAEALPNWIRSALHRYIPSGVDGP